MRGSPSQTRGALLELLRAQAGRRRPADLLGQYVDDAFVAASALDLRHANTLDRLALGSAPDFDAILLSPVAPLGTNSVVAPTSQDRTLSTIRNTEVVSDPTNVLALESARRLAGAELAGAELAGADATVRLVTVHQTLRAQSLAGGDDGARSRHFRLFALGEAGRGLADDEFEVRAVAGQLAVFDRFLDACEREWSVAFPRRRAIVRTGVRGGVLADRVLHRLSASLRHVELVTEPLDSVYYEGLRVGFGAEGRSGDFVEIADLGRFDWVAQLTGDRRMRFIASGLGVQLVPLLF